MWTSEDPLPKFGHRLCIIRANSFKVGHSTPTFSEQRITWKPEQFNTVVGLGVFPFLHALCLHIVLLILNLGLQLLWINLTIIFPINLLSNCFFNKMSETSETRPV